MLLNIKFHDVGPISGGYDTRPLNSIKPIKYAIKVVIKIPIMIAPVTFLTDKIEIIKNPIAARVSRFGKILRVIKDTWLPTIILHFLIQ